jgi:[acyl-carrier-protein] S-malonyltransferase
VHARAVTFADGLLLIRKDYETIKDIVKDQIYGMCSVIGLSRNDIIDLIGLLNLPVEITNQNSEFAFVLSGLHKDILDIMKAALNEGALHVHLLNVTLPYHSDFLKETKHAFSIYIDTIKFTDPGIKIISLADQKLLKDPADIKEEIIKNLFTPLNWYKTQSELQSSGVNCFVECGFGKSLVKNAKFIEGEFQFLSLLGFFKQMEQG